MTDLDERIIMLADLIVQSQRLVVFTGAGISTESGVPDFRGPNGVWTRQEKGLPPPAKVDWTQIQPNQGHMAVVELQNIGKLEFLISQNIDNLHLKSGIKPELIAEFHGNFFKLRCTSCEAQFDSFPDLLNVRCPVCEKGKLVSSVVNFGDAIPSKIYKDAALHSRNCDLFVVVGSSLVVHPAAGMPEIAYESGAKLVIINAEETPFDSICHLRFWERINAVLPKTVSRLKERMKT
jgi:NAD-dependent SIR2 family protein deacetylase